MDRDLPGLLTALMAERGLGVLALARKVPCDKALISRIASGKQRPSRQIARRLDDILQAGGTLAARAAQPPPPRPRRPCPPGGGNPAGSQSPTGRGSPREDEDDVGRRELLRIFTVAGAVMTGAAPGWEWFASLPAGDRRVSGADASQLAELNAHLWRVFGLARSKGMVFPLVRDQLDVITCSLQRAAGEAAYRRLCGLASGLFQLAGEIRFDGGRLTDAAHCYTLAAAAAREAGSADLWACALTRHAYLGLYGGDPRAARGMLELASRLGRRGDGLLSTRYWVAAVRAEVLAALGDRPGCERALAAAERVTVLGPGAQNGGWLRFDASRLAEGRGTCYAGLGRPDLAELALVTALSTNLSARRRGVVLADLAMTGVQRGDLEQAAEHAAAALRIVADTGSGVVLRKLAGLRGALSALPAERRARELDERITAVMGG